MKNRIKQQTDIKRAGERTKRAARPLRAAASRAPLYPQLATLVIAASAVACSADGAGAGSKSKAEPYEFPDVHEPGLSGAISPDYGPGTYNEPTVDGGIEEPYVETYGPELGGEEPDPYYQGIGGAGGAAPELPDDVELGPDGTPVVK